MDEEQRQLKATQRRRTLERKKHRHEKFRFRDCYSLYRNKRAEIFLIHRPYMHWIKRWNRHNYNVDDYLDYP